MSKLKFLSEHDPKVKYPAAVRKAFAELRKSEGPEAWRYEQPFSTISGVPVVFLTRLRAFPEFLKHIVETPRTHSRPPKFAWFIDAKVAAEVRAKLKESL